MVETEKVNKLLQHIPTDIIIKLNELIYVGAKQKSNKIGIPAAGESEPKYKTWMENEVRRTNKEVLISETANEGKTNRNPTERKDPSKRQLLTSLTT